MTAQDPIFCGRCGMPNPAGNQFCRKCGHRLADDVVEAEAPPRVEPPQSPVPGVTVERFPLVDPETGEEIAPPQIAAPSESPPAPSQADATPPPRRGSVILWSLAVHFVVTCVFGLITLVVLGQVMTTMSPDNVQELVARSEDIRVRFENHQIDPEQAQIEQRELFASRGVDRLLLILSASVLLGFFVSGFIAGRLWRPRLLLDVALSGLLLGGVCSLCPFNPFVWPLASLFWPLAFLLSLMGAMAGRRR